jgi:pyroglutamyl-peptidase
MGEATPYSTRGMRDVLGYATGAMRILVTGFEPFGGHVINSSTAVVNALPRSERLVTRILPTVYAESGRIIEYLIRDEQPDAVVCLGLCARSPAILLERVALNINDDTCGDNAGDCANGRVIIPEGPVGYWSTLPLAALHAAMIEKGVPVAWSNSAGTYVCNHVFYTARHATEQLGGDRPCGFVHLPQAGDGGLPLPMLVDAIETCLDVIERNAVTK